MSRPLSRHLVFVARPHLLSTSILGLTRRWLLRIATATLHHPKPETGTPKRHALNAAVAVAVALLSSPNVVHATVWTYPGCDMTVQGCINGAVPGDTVQIATNAPIDEDLQIKKSLTLKSAAGFTATLAAGVAGHSVAVFAPDPPPYPDLIVTIQGITLQGGNVGAFYNSNALTLTVEDCVVNTYPYVSGSVGISAVVAGTPPGGSGAFNATIRNNRVTLPNQQPGDDTSSGIVVGMSADSGGTGGTAVIEHNTIAMGTVVDGQNEGAIIVQNGAGTSTATVARNIISGLNFNDGIIFNSTSGAVTATILNNVVTGESGGVGLSAAIGVSGSGGPINAYIANNTVTGNLHGIQVLGSNALGTVINNIIANITMDGIALTGSSATNSNNLVFNTGPNFYTPGSGTVNANPMFVGAGDFHLSPGSPAFNVGSAAVLSKTNIDLDGVPRSYGAGVDIGAYESQCTFAGANVTCNIDAVGGQAGPAIAGGPKVIVPPNAVPNGTTVSVSSGATSQYGSGNTSGNLVGGVAAFSSTDSSLAVCAGGAQDKQSCTSSLDCSAPGVCQFSTIFMPWPPGSSGQVDSSGILETNLKAFHNLKPLGTCALYQGIPHPEVLCDGTVDLPCPGNANCNNNKTCAQQGCPAGSALCCDPVNNTWILKVSKFSEYAVGIDECQAIASPQLKVTKVLAPTGDDGLNVRGTFTLPAGTTTAELDPSQHGIRLGIADTDADAVVLDVLLAPGAYDAVAKIGWKTNGAGTKWTYVHKGPTPPGNIVRASVQDLSNKAPGLVKFRFKGKQGAYGASTAVVADVTVPGAQVCYEASFPGPAPICTLVKSTLKCK